MLQKNFSKNIVNCSKAPRNEQKCYQLCTVLLKCITNPPADKENRALFLSAALAMKCQQQTGLECSWVVLNRILREHRAEPCSCAGLEYSAGHINFFFHDTLPVL